MVLVELPGEVAHVAVVVMEGAQLLASTPLLPAPLDGRLRAELSAPAEEGSNLHLFGFTEQQLDALLPEPIGPARETPLRLASSDEPALPPPRFHASERLASGASTLRVGPAPELGLTAAWLGDCPPLPSSPLLGVSCALRPCTPTVKARQCELELGLDTCLNLPTRILGKRDPAGEVGVRLEGEGLLGCEPRARVEAGQARFDCTRADGVACPIHLLDPAAPEFRVQLDRVRLEPDSGAEPTYPFHTEPETLRGLVVRGEHVYVHHRSEALYGCAGGPAGDRFSVLGADQLELRRSEPFSACVVSVAADPAGDGILVLSLEGATARIHRLDAQLAPTEARDLPASTPTHQLRPVQLSTRVDAGWIGVLLARHQVGGERLLDGATVLRLDPASLAVTASVTRERVVPDALLHVGSGRVALIDEEEDDVYLLDELQLAVEQRLRLRTESSSTRRIVSSSHWHQPSNRLFVGHVSTIDMGLIPVELGRGATESVRVIFEHRGAPMDMGPWPLDPELMLVAYIRPELPLEGYLTLYDPRQARFRLGATPLGLGAARFLQADLAGRVWAALPWSGEVVRVTPLFGPD